MQYEPCLKKKTLIVYIRVKSFMCNKKKVCLKVSNILHFVRVNVYIFYHLDNSVKKCELGLFSMPVCVCWCVRNRVYLMSKMWDNRDYTPR